MGTPPDNFWRAIEDGNFLRVNALLPVLPTAVLQNCTEQQKAKIKQFFVKSEDHIITWRAAKTPGEELSGLRCLQAIDALIVGSQLPLSGREFLTAVVRQYDYEVDRISLPEQKLICDLLERYILTPSCVAPPTPLDWVELFKTVVLEHFDIVLDWCVSKHVFDAVLDCIPPDNIEELLLRTRRPFDNMFPIRDIFANATCVLQGQSFPLDIRFGNNVSESKIVGCFLTRNPDFAANICANHPAQIHTCVEQLSWDPRAVITTILLKNCDPRYGNESLVRAIVYRNGGGHDANYTRKMGTQQICAIVAARPQLLAFNPPDVQENTLYDFLLGGVQFYSQEDGAIEGFRFAIKELESVRQKSVLEQSLQPTQSATHQRKL